MCGGVTVDNRNLNTELAKDNGTDFKHFIFTL